MVEIRGFRGFVFDASKAGALDAVLTPPYDVIEPQQRNQLAGSNPWNMTHLTLPVASEGLSPYDHAARLLKNWLQAGILAQDATPGVYLLRQQFNTPDGGVALERKAFFALLRLPESGEQYILGHERTFDSPIEDRLALMRAVPANLEPIFVMYSDAELRLSERLFASLAAAPPLLSARTADGVLQELWRSDVPEELAPHFHGQTLYIADGHHRFKTACMYRDERRRQAGAFDTEQAFNFIMAGFVAFEEPGLKIYAAHRVVPASFKMPFTKIRERLAPYFSFQELSDGEVNTARLAACGTGCHFILYTPDGGGWLLELDEVRRNELLASDRHQAWRDLDVAVLHRGVLERLLGVPESLLLRYEKDDQDALASVDAGEGAFACLLRPTRSDQVRACAEAFEPMPQKSTYYFPKMPSGAVLHLFD